MENVPLTFTILLANSASDKLVIFFLIFPRKQILIFHHANCQILFSRKKKEKYFQMSSVENFTRSANRLN